LDSRWTVYGHWEVFSHMTEHPVLPIEPFFDLVFVFIITQLTHVFVGHLTLAGALQVGLIFVVLFCM